MQEDAVRAVESEIDDLDDEKEEYLENEQMNIMYLSNTHLKQLTHQLRDCKEQPMTDRGLEKCPAVL